MAHDEEALLARLLQKNPKPIAFLVGVGLATHRRAPRGASISSRSRSAKIRRDDDYELAGIANVKEVLEIIKERLLKCSIGDVPRNYQDAFELLLKWMGPHEARRVVREAVSAAYRGEDFPNVVGEDRESERPFRDLDQDSLGWELTPGTAALGALYAEFPDRFGKYLFTTNYDPTIAVSIRQARGSVVQTVINRDGNPGQTIVEGCHLVHLHGYWHTYDTLHTRAQLEFPRPNLQAFMCEILRSFTVVVIGYGGWDDLFALAALHVANNEPNAQMDVLWAFNAPGDDEQTARVKKRLEPAAQASGRVSYFYGINCHLILPKLLRRLRAYGAEQTLAPPSDATDLPVDARATLVTDGYWLIFPDHGEQRYLKLEKGTGGTGPVQEYRGVFHRGEMADKPYTWQFDEDELVIAGANSQELVIPAPFNGPIQASPFVPHRPQNKMERLVEWEEAWRGSWKAKGEDVGPRRPREKGKISLPAVAAHVASWSNATVKEFDDEGVTQGQWIKMSAAGGTYVVKLLPDGTLTESHILDVTNQWYGVWWIDGQPNSRVLHIFIGSWRLSIPEDFDADFAKQGINIRRGGEVHPPAEGPLTFYVAHVIPYTEQVLNSSSASTRP